MVLLAICDDLVLRLERDHRQDRAEDLFLGESHVGRDAVEDGRLDEVAVLSELPS